MKQFLIFLLITFIIALLYFNNRQDEFNLPPKSEPLVRNNLGLSLVAGFSISVFADNIPDARVISFDPAGVMLASSPSEGKIFALPDKDGNEKADGVEVVVGNLNRPHGMEWRCRDPENPKNCTFYIAETDKLSEFAYDPDAYKATGKRKLIDLPSGGGHFTRTLLFMPSPNEDMLLVSVGSSCNVCKENNDRRASIIAYDINTGKSEIFANGLRNSVFMSIHPVTGDIWATEMGRDNLGDDIPPDEINIIKKDNFYGWPWLYGKNIRDESFQPNVSILPVNLNPPIIEITAHSAPLGLAFFGEEGWSEDYWHDLLVAYHGSWNRSVPTGYKIVRIKLDEKGNFNGIEDFITGWLKEDGTRSGRPVDIKIFPAGPIYISDDQAGVIYRVVKTQ